MLNAHFKSSGFNRNQKDLRVHIEQVECAPPVVRDIVPAWGWPAWTHSSP